MERTEVSPKEPPSPSTGSASFPGRAFGHGTARYFAFLEALVEGLRAYEAAQGGGKSYGSAPLPAA
jgi:hypothetical protein